MIQVIRAVVTLVLIFSVAGALGVLWGLFLTGLIPRVVRSPLYHWSREVDRYRTELTLSVIHVPLLSAAMGVGVGIGVNVVADSADTAAGAAGLVVIVAAAILYALWSARLLKRTRENGHWLRQVRYQLYRFVDDPEFTPVDPAQSVARIRRLRRVGERLTDRASALTWRRWANRVPLGGKMIVVCWLVSVLSFAGLLISNIVTTEPDPTTTQTAATIGSAVIAGPIGAVFDRRNTRWWLRQLGTELTDAASRAEAALIRRTPPLTMLQRIRRQCAQLLWAPEPTARRLRARVPRERGER